MADLFTFGSFGDTCNGMQYITFIINGRSQDEHTVLHTRQPTGQSQCLESMVSPIDACMFRTIQNWALSQSSLILDNDKLAHTLITKFVYFEVKKCVQNFFKIISTCHLRRLHDSKSNNPYRKDMLQSGHGMLDGRTDAQTEGRTDGV